MDIWEERYLNAKDEYHPEDVSPFIESHHAVATVQSAKEFLGKTVDVVIDRPFGSKHPKYGFIYPLNYGYIPNTISGDGEELDAYLLGVFEPVSKYEKGKVIAYIHRINDDDDKLIVVPDGYNYNNDQILALTEFQERFFESEIYRVD